MNNTNNMILEELRAQIANPDNSATIRDHGAINTHEHDNITPIDTCCDNDFVNDRRLDRGSIVLYCLQEKECKSIEDNGVAFPSTSVDVIGEPMEATNFSLRSSSSNAIRNNPINELEYMTTSRNTKSIEEGSIGAVVMRALSEQNGRIDGLERLIERVLDRLDGSGTQNSNAGLDNRLIQFTEKVPNKITIQYFVNRGKKVPPRIKLELRHKLRDSNNKPYHPVYQTVFGNCYRDFGLTKLDKLARLTINEQHADDINELRNNIEWMNEHFTNDGDLLGTFFYCIETSEVFCGAYVLVDKTTNDGVISLYNGTKFVDHEIEFKPSKSSGTAKGSDGVYTINQDIIDAIID